MREGVIVVNIRCAWERISAPPPATASLQKAKKHKNKSVRVCVGGDKTGFSWAGNKRKQPTHNNWFLFHQDGTDPVGKVAVLCIREREFS